MRTREAVRIEIRAATIARLVEEHQAVDWLGAELAGWMRAGDNRERGSDPKSRAWQAGWLACTNLVTQ